MIKVTIKSNVYVLEKTTSFLLWYSTMSFLYFNIYLSKIKLITLCILKLFNYTHNNNHVCHRFFFWYLMSLMQNPSQHCSEQTLKIHQSCCSLTFVTYRIIHPTKTIALCYIPRVVLQPARLYGSKPFPSIRVAHVCAAGSCRRCHLAHCHHSLKGLLQTCFCGEEVSHAEFP